MSQISKVRTVVFGLAAFVTGSCGTSQEAETRRPNILLLMSDNHSWNHLGCYGDPVVKTPVIDQLAATGIRFSNAFCSAPSCTPARASMLTGQDIWRLEEGANLWGTLPAKFETYTELLENAGYLVGIEGKGWGPGDHEAGGRARNPGGNRYNSFEEFYNLKERGQPFYYWFSSRDPHRPYRPDGARTGNIDPAEVVVPSYLPDTEEVRLDICDYYAEIQSFDREVAGYIQLVKEMGELENTLIIVCSDNGWQMPRGLANLYDFGTRIPLIVNLPGRFQGGRVVDDLVSLNDFAPTFLELAGVPLPGYMTAKSLVPILESEQGGIVDPGRDAVFMGRERHAYVRQGGPGYGARAIRTRDFLYIHNYEPDLWPAGDPPLFGDVDAHMLQYPCATKIYMLKNRQDPNVKGLFDLAFGKRPAEELYDVNADPDQLENLAYEPTHQEIRQALSDRLKAYLRETGDPREIGGEMKWKDAAYFAGKDKTPRPSEEARKELGLEAEYSYMPDGR